MRVTFRRRRWLVPSRKKSWRSSTRVFRGTNARCVSTRNSPRWRWSSRCSTKRSVDAVASDSSSALDCYAWSLASVKSRLVLLFWYWLTWVVPERAVKRVCVCSGVTLGCARYSKQQPSRILQAIFCMLDALIVEQAAFDKFFSHI